MVIRASSGASDRYAQTVRDLTVNHLFDVIEGRSDPSPKMLLKGSARVEERNIVLVPTQNFESTEVFKVLKDGSIELR